jgi:hypothetical protein
MNSYAKQLQENKNQKTVAVTQKRNNNNVSNYPAKVAQMQFQEIANNSLQVKQALQLKSIANSAFPIQKKGVEEELQMKTDPIQRKGTEEEELQMKADPVQRKGVEEEELQMKAAPIQRKGIEEEEAVQSKFALPIQKKANNTGLPDNLKSGIENLSGFAMDDVKVHYNSAKPAQLQAHAYAQGTDIHLGSGQEKHLPHEAWHVVQQKQGRVQPTMQMKGNINVNDDAGLENEADVMGGKAHQFIHNQSETTKNNTIEIPSNRNFPASKQNVAQLLTVSDDHVRGDLRHKVGNTLFEDYTLTDIEQRAGAPISTVSNVVLDQAVNQSRAAGMMDYAHLRQEKVTSEKQLTQYLDKSPDDEHMYVLDNSELHVAIRADDKKLPHPTLVGGDPDVECAGTLRRDNDDYVFVTASSGHFRPPSEGPGQKAVDKIMGKTSSAKNKKKVKGSRR